MTLPHELDSPQYWELFEHRRRHSSGCPGVACRRFMVDIIEFDTENGSWHMFGGGPTEEVTPRRERSA
jgi:hypothetical protein